MTDKGKLPGRMVQEGFDLEMSMEICANDLDILADVLETAWQEGLKKLRIIRQCIEIKDYERYRVEVHALKNAAKAFGAVRLSALALEQEQAAKEQQYENIVTGSTALLAEYESVVALLGDMIR